jgi:hypothetical protein
MHKQPTAMSTPFHPYRAFSLIGVSALFALSPAASSTVGGGICGVDAAPPKFKHRQAVPVAAQKPISMPS